MKLYLNESPRISDEQLNQIDLLWDKYDSGNGKGYEFTPEAIRLIQKDIATILNISLESAKDFMIKSYSFDEDDFNYDTSKPSTKNNDNAYIKIGKAIANYYEEIIYGSDTIHIQCANRNNTKAMYKEITDALNSIK